MSIEFLPPIDLTFGFTLNAVGGVVGIEHRLDTDALRAGISDRRARPHHVPGRSGGGGAGDPVDARAACSRFDHGSIVIGPMIEIGWGRPVSFLTAQVGVILSLPDPMIVIIGRGAHRAAGAELPIVDLRATCTARSRPTTC